MSDLFSSAKGPGLVGLGLAAVVLGGLSLLMTLALEDEDLSIEQDMVELNYELNYLKDFEGQVIAYQDVAKKNQQTVERLQEVVNELNAKSAELMQKEQELDDEKASVAELYKQIDQYKVNYREAEWASARGEKYEALKTLRGREYQSVEVRKVSAAGMEIRHAIGTARIPYDHLPSEMQDRFQFTAEAASSMAQEELAFRKRLESDHARAADRRTEREKLYKDKLAKRSNYLARAKIKSLQNALKTKEELHMASIERVRALRAKADANNNRGLSGGLAKREEERAAELQKSIEQTRSEISRLSRQVRN
ncbi:hypothetical protein [Persicirhabdus sediminis]|uniref:Uncharacterized protein n=1 Tax=Persicirhabdus sediminis TaxID=454144 RepID=A0A8J7ME82_9BACT|nr:hypothetical protein [Persicirhabdus sediminis]MBK1791077.1 hypothetical protein [Persicirhabdus sediminis]